MDIFSADVSDVVVHKDFFSQCWWNGFPQHCEFVCRFFFLFVFVAISQMMT